jgi:hypothetical protein
MTHFHAVPETGDGIVLLTNSQRSWPLLAHTLRDWAAWSGLGAVQFSRISGGVAAVRVAAVALAALSLWVAVGLASAVRGGRRRWAPWHARARAARASQALLGLAMLALLAWRASLPYTIESSVFPGVIGALAWATAMLTLVLVVSAAFPRTRTG